MSAQLYLILGDPFLAEDRIKKIVRDIEKQHKGTVSTTKYRLSETPLDHILKEARNLPFLTDAQIFLLKDADAIKEKKLESFENYLANPSSTAYLIFEAESVDRRGSFAKMIAKKGEVITLDEQQKKPESTKYIQQRLKVANKTIAPNALARIVEQTGDVPMALDSVLDQLISYSASETQITREMVEKFEENWQEINVFDLVNAIASKRTGQALTLLKRLLQETGDLFSLLGLLHWQIKRYWLAKALLEEGVSERAVLQRCRISPQQAPYFMRQLRQFKLSKLETALEGLFQLDWKVKTGRAEGEVEMEKWLVEVTS